MDDSLDRLVAGGCTNAKRVVTTAAKRSPKRPVKTGNVGKANWEANNRRERKDLYTGMLAILI